MRSTFFSIVLISISALVFLFLVKGDVRAQVTNCGGQPDQTQCLYLDSQGRYDYGGPNFCSGSCAGNWLYICQGGSCVAQGPYHCHLDCPSVGGNCQESVTPEGAACVIPSGPIILPPEEQAPPGGCPSGQVQCGSYCYLSNSCPSGYSWQCNFGQGQCVASGGGTPPPPQPGPIPPPIPPPLPPPGPLPAGYPTNLTYSISCSGATFPGSIFFSWGSAPGALSYIMDISSNNGSIWGVYYSGTGLSFNWVPLAQFPGSGPQPNTTYWWRVKAIGSGAGGGTTYYGNTIVSPGVSFVTPSSTCGSPPPPTPPGGSSSTGYVYITWDKNNDGVYGGTGENFGFSGNQNFDSSVASLTVDGVSQTPNLAGQVVFSNWSAGTSHNAQVVPGSGWVQTGWSFYCTDNPTSSNSYTTPNYTASATVPSGCPNGYALYLGINNAPSPPTNPSGLLPPTISGCGASASVTFNWTASSGQTGYLLDVNGAAWTGDSAPSPWGFKSLGGSAVQFVWSSSAGMDSGDVDPITIGNQTTPSGKTYWWRLIATNAVGSSAHVYPPSTTAWPGTSFTIPGCLDLKARFVKPFASPWPNYNAGGTATMVVRVSNVGTLAYSGGTGVLGFWPTGGPAVPASASSCTAASPPASPLITFSTGSSGNAGNLPAIGIGSSVDVTVSFNVGSSSGTANAFVLPTCSPNDVYWPNNHTSGPVNSSNPNDVDAPLGSDPPGTTVGPGGFSYTVSVPAWFETVGGDVGAKAGSISVSQAPWPGPFPAKRYLSDYLGAATGSLISGQIKGWSISSYTGTLFSSGTVYNYMADRFLTTAKTFPSSCNVPSGNRNGFNYCNGDAIFNAGGGPAGSPVIYFIDGNLTISSNLTLNPSDSAIFIVKDDINVSTTNVTRIDGIYIAGGTFKDTDSAGGTDGSQLVVNGAVYSHAVSLARKLSATATCLYAYPTCDNVHAPADEFVYNAKYIDVLSGIIGNPSISWNEVAP